MNMEFQKGPSARQNLYQLSRSSMQKYEIIAKLRKKLRIYSPLAHILFPFLGRITEKHYISKTIKKN